MTSFTAALIWGILNLPVPDVEPAYAETPEFCWTEPKWIEDDRAKDPARSPKWVARAVAAHVIRRTGSSEVAEQPARARIAEMVSGSPKRGRYVEAQFYICDKQGKPNYERDHDELELLHLGFPIRRTGRIRTQGQ